MSAGGYVLLFLGMVVATFLGVAIYTWVKAERDERAWRKLMEEEQPSWDVPRYRMVMDERSDRE